MFCWHDLPNGSLLENTGKIAQFSFTCVKLIKQIARNHPVATGSLYYRCTLSTHMTFSTELVLYIHILATHVFNAVISICMKKCEFLHNIT